MKQLRNFSGQRENNSFKQGDKLMDEAMKKFGGMDESALMTQLLGNIRQQRQDGVYDEAKLLSFVNMMSPHLTNEQREKLGNIIGMLNGKE